MTFSPPAFLALAAFAFSAPGFAHQKVCFGTAENKGNRVVLEINKNQVEVVEVESHGVNISVGNRLDHIKGETYLLKKIMDGTHRYDMDFDFGGSSLLLIDSALVGESKNTGAATIRTVGDNGLLYIRLFCRNEH